MRRYDVPEERGGAEGRRRTSPHLENVVQDSLTGNRFSISKELWWRSIYNGARRWRRRRQWPRVAAGGDGSMIGPRCGLCGVFGHVRYRVVHAWAQLPTLPRRRRVGSRNDWGVAREGTPSLPSSFTLPSTPGAELPSSFILLSRRGRYVSFFLRNRFLGKLRRKKWKLKVHGVYKSDGVRP